jgi:hypothetical protein
MRRRTVVAALGASFFTGVRTGWAAPSPEAQRRQNRLELWHNYAGKTDNLVARLTTTRETSLLDEPLTVTGMLVFLGPDTLILRDEGLRGSTTLITAEGSRTFASSAQVPPVRPRGREPAVDWIADRLVAMFARSADPETLVAGARVSIPRGGGYRMELLPPKGSTIRRRVRSVAVELDPVAGAVTQITIAEAQGDRVVLGLADHRQNLAELDLEPLLAPVRDYLPSDRE